MLKRVRGFLTGVVIILVGIYIVLFVLERMGQKPAAPEVGEERAQEVEQAATQPTLVADPTRTLRPTATEIPIRTVELRQALKDGIATLEAIGDGLESLDMILDSLSDEDLRIEVLPGTIFHPANSGTQSMVVRRGALIDLPAGEQAQQELEVGCASMEKGTPSLDDTFSLDLELSLTDLVDLLELVEFLEEDFRVQQFAIWTVTDNPSANRYVGLGYFGAGSGPSEEELERIYHMFLKAGIQTGKYRALAKYPTPTPAPSATLAPIDVSNCILAEEIRAAYIGQTVCVYGVVAYTYQGEGYTSLGFSKQAGAFYLLSYDINLKNYASGACVRAVGEVKDLAGNPVMVVGYKDAPEVCP